MNRERFFDFLDPRLSGNCEITSDGVSDDFYCLDNLISTDVSKRNLGFMAFQVSKPPIEITIKFKWKIDLKMIKIHAELMSLKSTKFQVFIKCIHWDGNEIMRKIGDVALNESQVGFCLKTSDVDKGTDDSYKVEDIYPYTRKSIRAVDFIKIVIQDSRLRRAPVMKKIEVFGYPSKDNSQDEINTLKRLMREPEKQPSNVKDSNINPQPDKQTGFTIPEEFLDAITNELLVCPYILPSGNSVDESTIEKHNRHEETYGRLPSDPFTSLIYTSDNQPKFNDCLKHKLDEFKLRNSNELDVKMSGRTLGKKQKPQEPVASTSSYTANDHVSKKIKLNGNSSSDLDSLISSIYKNNQVSIFTKPKESAPDTSSKCSCCKATTSPAFYQILSCSHIHCKPCLLRMSSNCGLCKISFNSKDVEKVNL